MPFIPCGQNIGCPGTDYPISNFSSELDDTLDYISLAFTGGTSPYTDPTVINSVGSGNAPPLGSNFTTPGGCFGIGEGATQGGAASTALTTAQSCGAPPTGGGAYSNPIPTGNAVSNPQVDNGVGNGPTQIPQSGTTAGSGPGTGSFFNNAQTAQCNTCPDGTVGGSYTVQAGTYTARTQALADQLAMQAASANANKNCVCAPDFSGSYCDSDIISADTGNISGANPPFMIKLTGNAPPTFDVFMISNTEYQVVGGPMPAGTYNFGVQVTDANNNTATAPSTIDVLGISNLNQLPDAQCQNPYSFQLIGAGGSPPYTFNVSGGGFQTGVSMNSNGLITGTPVGCGAGPVSITITDSTGRMCTDETDFIVQGPCNPPLTMDLIGGFVGVTCPPPPASPGGTATAVNSSGFYRNDAPHGIQVCGDTTALHHIHVEFTVKLRPGSIPPGPFYDCFHNPLSTSPNCSVGMQCGSVSFPFGTITSDLTIIMDGTAHNGDSMSISGNAICGEWQFRLSVTQLD